MRKQYNAAFKAHTALEAVRGERTAAETASEYGVHPNQIGKWKKQLLEELPKIFSGRDEKKEKLGKELVDQLYQQIGQLKVELDWLKKKPGFSADQRRELIGLARSTLYYRPESDTSESDRQSMRLIDEQYTKTPFYGIRRMTVWLKSQGYRINRKKVSRLMKLMGIRAIYPKRRLSAVDSRHTKYPYLLDGLIVDRPNLVWATDITYIRMKSGFVYLTAILDWFSRYVVSWAVSITLDVDFCIEALHKALNVSQPEIFNSDQGSQFTSGSFTSILEAHGVAISMDGRGRAFDNIFVERLWRSVKYEEVYLKEYTSVKEAVQSLGEYFRFYNRQRPHQSLGYKTPHEVYTSENVPGTDSYNILSKQRGLLHLKKDS